MSKEEHTMLFIFSFLYHYFFETLQIFAYKAITITNVLA